ncbi:MAG: HTTM domain-containing protein [Vicinamibacterales bacterium]
MIFEQAQRLTEVLLALAVLQQALEHLVVPTRDRGWFVVQAILAFAVADGGAPAYTQGALLVACTATIRHFRGPYNGGSDRMRLLVLGCLWLSHLSSSPTWRQIFLGYLAVQVLLSYVVAGVVKLVNPEWRDGRALRDVFLFSVYPVSESLRRWAGQPSALLVASWAIMLIEVAFPLALAHVMALKIALGVALAFHIGNACLFGLNRFVWAWVAAYPSLLWFQQELVTRLF